MEFQKCTLTGALGLWERARKDTHGRALSPRAECRFNDNMWVLQPLAVKLSGQRWSQLGQQEYPPGHR
jgi:hypothetical protein